jgi:nucleoside-triphosphatase THEP1
MMLSPEQRGALEHVTSGKDLGIVIGYAGTGKSAMLGVAREAWENAGYRVHGLALSGIAAENLESGSGIASRTIASLEHQWAQGRELLTSKDVLVIDEAGMIGTRQMERVIAEAQRRQAKVVLVGDPEQLQAIEAGAAFRSIAERHGGVEITAIRRQREDWQRDATRQLATGRTEEAVRAYDEAGHVHAVETREQARADLVDRWDRDRIASPDTSRIILTHTNDEVRDLNHAARARLRAAGALGEDVTIAAERGSRTFAPGDRIMFLRNDRGLGVKNGTLGTVESLTNVRMAVLLDDGRAVAFDIKDYAQVEHGYAATIHKAQGMTVDRVNVLATPGLDRHSAYVALSRHRERVDLHYGRDDFADQGKLVRALSRERGKDMASDYEIAPAGPATITPTSPARNPFAGLRLKTGPTAEPQVTPLGTAVERYARAVVDVYQMRQEGMNELPHQRAALVAAVQALDAVQPHASHDLRTALARAPELIDEAAKGRTAATIRAMALETEIRIGNAQRADRFVAEWQRQARQFKALDRAGEGGAAARVRHSMAAMAKSLERDPQLESLLRARAKDLGIGSLKRASLYHDLQDWLGLSRSRGLGR